MSDHSSRPTAESTRAALEGTPARWRVALGSSVGATIETYDFIGFGTAAALYFNDAFFPSSNPLSGTLLSFATLGVGFAVRPLGGILGGHLGDRIGRKPVLVGSLLVMGIATVLIGALPTYAQAGVWAGILLVIVRLVQGLAFGAEWGGAILMTFEHAPVAQTRPVHGAHPGRFPGRPAAGEHGVPSEHAAGRAVGMAGPVPAQRRADRDRHRDPGQGPGVPRVRATQVRGQGREEPAAGRPAHRLAQRAAGVLHAHHRNRRLRPVGHIRAVVSLDREARGPLRHPARAHARRRARHSRHDAVGRADRPHRPPPGLAADAPASSPIS